MDFLNKFTDQHPSNDNQTIPTGNNQPGSNTDNGNNFGGEQAQQQQNAGNSSGNNDFFGKLTSGITDKFNNAAGGGRESEKNEDYLDKGIDFVQEKFLGQGAQDNETAVEQAKDEQISDYIRGQYRTKTGSDLPIQDKPTTFDRFSQ